jgi:antitoxin component of MazEF toxin-antitoxin module
MRLKVSRDSNRKAYLRVPRSLLRKIGVKNGDTIKAEYVQYSLPHPSIGPGYITIFRK